MRIEILLRLFITLYGLSGLGTFSAYIPNFSKIEDKWSKSNMRDYLFRLLTSIIFFLYAIFIMQDWRISCLLVIELVVLISTFAWLAYKKKTYVMKMLKKMGQRNKHF
ncbi:MAG: hypothetical protein LBP53_08020 [Candidatus Peribacteria bacterium]|jgi:Ca2+/Na+ antiporter|nr:hypothetical protein [Candidatus Peribacteria bacterium]